jgi:DNA-binding CsgD family transcriptional regulator
MTRNTQPSAIATPREQRHAPAASGRARDHVTSLREQGGTYRSIAQAAGLAPMTVQGIAVGRTRPQEHTTVVVLAVSAATLDHARVDAGGTRLRLRALHVMGHGSARIARAVGVSPRTIRSLVRGDSATVSTRLRDAVTTVYDAWWDKRAPERTRHERAAATSARRRAITGNWCAAAALDDDELDRPGYRPAYGWRPARGTGTAPSFPRPVLDRVPSQRTRQQ